MRSLTVEEYVHFLALYSIDPWGEGRADLRTATVAATISNIFRGKGKPAKGPQDFMAYVDKDTKRRTLASRLRSSLKAWRVNSAS